MLGCDDEPHLGPVDVDGTGFYVLLELGQPEASGLTWVGDPTVSDDGRWLVFVGSTMRKRGEPGSRSTTDLYLYDLRDERLRRTLLGEGARGSSSSAIRFPTRVGPTRLARLGHRGDYRKLRGVRRRVRRRRGNLGEPSNVSNDPEARDQDPMFQTM